MKSVVAFIFYISVVEVFEAANEVSITPYPTANVTEFTSLTLTCITNQTVRILTWSSDSNDSDVVFIPQSDGTCSLFGGSADSAYEYSCGTQLTWKIVNVTRERHEEKWSCKINTGKEIYSSSFTEINVQVPVASVELKHNTAAVDDQVPLDVIAGTPTTLTCSTSPVSSRPTPIIEWYVGTTRKQSSPNTTFSLTASDHDHNQIVYCKAYNIRPDDAVESVKPRLYVKVEVSKVTLLIGDSELRTGQNLTVTADTPVTLTCTPGHSRPSPTIDWYIGTERKKNSSTTYKLNPADGDHNKNICCKAHNFPGREVRSARPKLYVKVQVSSVTIKKGTHQLITGENLTVTQGDSTTLTCTTGVSRPTATINWFIGSEEQSTTGPTFTFVSSNSNHDSDVYCTAYNLQPNKSVGSLRPKLYVRVKAAAPALLNGTENGITLLDGDSYTLQCQSTATRPAAIVTWRIGSRDISDTNTNTREVTGSLGLVSVISTVSYVASRNDTNLHIICKSKIPSQSDSPESKMIISIWWAPATPTVEAVGTNFPWLEGRTGILNCTSPDGGNPTSSVIWPSNIGNRNDQNQLVITTLTYEHDKLHVKCQLQNQFTSIKGGDTESREKQLDVQYSPRVTIKTDNIVADRITLVEGNNKEVTCTAIGHPQPNVNWPGAPSLSAGGMLTFVDTNRSQADNYTCRAAANSMKYPSHSFTTEMMITVTVHFPPDVKIEVQGDTTENQTVVITCLPEGLPRLYSYHGWTQVWNGTNITSNPALQRDSTFSIVSLQLQDSGNYTCNVDNSIRDRQDQLYQHGTAEILVKVTPKIFMLEPIFAGKYSENITISFPFYTYPLYQSVILKSNDTEIQNSSKYGMFIEETDVMTEFYEKSVHLKGQRLTLTVNDLDEADFTVYHVYIRNDVGTTEMPFSVISETIPRQPSNFQLLSLKGSTAMFAWIRGFNGGHNQTFLIQLTNEGQENWVNGTAVGEYDDHSNLGNKSYIANITDLKPGSYSVQLVAFNDIGPTEPMPLSSTIVIPAPAEEVPTPFPIGAAAGGAGAAILVILVVILAVVWKRRSKPKHDDYKKSMLSPKRRTNGPDSADTAEVNINPMYESADMVQLPPSNDVYAEVNKHSKQPFPGTSGDLYAQVKKQKVDTSSKQTFAVLPDIYSTPVKKGKEQKGVPPSDVYSVPDKKGKGKEKKGKKQKEKKKSKSGKQNEGSLYENATPMNNETKDPENVYENPACSTSDEKPKRTRTDDGLIYIDVELPQQKDAKNQKPVIHGEEKTIYADVAYGQVGEPVPESDEEEKPKET